MEGVVGIGMALFYLGSLLIAYAANLGERKRRIKAEKALSVLVQRPACDGGTHKCDGSKCGNWCGRQPNERK